MKKKNKIIIFLLVILAFVSIFFAFSKLRNVQNNTDIEEGIVVVNREQIRDEIMEKYQPYFVIFKIYGFIHDDGSVEFYSKYKEATQIVIDSLKDRVEERPDDELLNTWLTEKGYSLEKFITIDDVVNKPDEMLEFILLFPENDFGLIRFLIDEEITKTLEENKLQNFDLTQRAIEIEKLEAQRTDSSN